MRVWLKTGSDSKSAYFLTYLHWVPDLQLNGKPHSCIICNFLESFATFARNFMFFFLGISSPCHTRSIHNLSRTLLNRRRHAPLLKKHRRRPNTRRAILDLAGGASRTPTKEKLQNSTFCLCNRPVSIFQ